MNFWRICTYGVAFSVLVFPLATALSNSSSSSVKKAGTLPSLPVVKKAPLTAVSVAPKIFKLNVSVSKPEDLKVRQGDTVIAGEIIADRVGDRARLNSAKKELEISLKKIDSNKIFVPSAPKNVPAVGSLPSAKFKEQEADILDAQMRVKEAQMSLDLHKRSLALQPPKETSELEQAKVAVSQAKNKLELQQRKTDAIAEMQLPEVVSEHETKVAEQLQSELVSREAEERVAAANLEAASLGAADKERQLLSDLDRAKSNLELIKSRLDTARERRQREEYEHELQLSQRAEQQNQAELAFSRQLQESQQQQREKDYQLAQVKSRMQEVDNQLAQLSTIKSPYSGVVRRIKYEGQNNQDLQVSVTLATGVVPVESPRTEGDRRPLAASPSKR